MINKTMPYTKKRIAFTNKAIFEYPKFKPDIEKCFCIVSRMMYENRINVDGTIDMEQAGYVRKYQLWAYIYYLYYYNSSSLDDFQAMKTKDENASSLSDARIRVGKASGEKFFMVVREAVQNGFVKDDEVTAFDVNTLIYFINLMHQRYQGVISNPIAQYLEGLLARKGDLVRLARVSVVTGDPKNALKILTDPSNIEKANIKITMTQSSKD
jgi:hypothetical protein